MANPFKYPMVDQSLFWARERHPVYDVEGETERVMPFRWVLGLPAGGREMTDLIEEAVTTRLIPLVESWFDYQTLVERMERNISGEFVWISPMSRGLVLAKLDAAPVEEVEADLNALTDEDDAGFVAWARVRLAARQEGAGASAEHALPRPDGSVVAQLLEGRDIGGVILFGGLHHQRDTSQHAGVNERPEGFYSNAARTQGGVSVAFAAHRVLSWVKRFSGSSGLGVQSVTRVDRGLRVEVFAG